MLTSQNVPLIDWQREFFPIRVFASQMALLRPFDFIPLLPLRSVHSFHISRPSVSRGAASSRPASLAPWNSASQLVMTRRLQQLAATARELYRKHFVFLQAGLVSDTASAVSGHVNLKLQEL